MANSGKRSSISEAVFRSPGPSHRAPRSNLPQPTASTSLFPIQYPSIDRSFEGFSHSIMPNSSQGLGVNEGASPGPSANTSDSYSFAISDARGEFVNPFDVSTVVGRSHPQEEPYSTSSPVHILQGQMHDLQFSLASSYRPPHLGSSLYAGLGTLSDLSLVSRAGLPLGKFMQEQHVVKEHTNVDTSYSSSREHDQQNTLWSDVTSPPCTGTMMHLGSPPDHWSLSPILERRSPNARSARVLKTTVAREELPVHLAAQLQANPPSFPSQNQIDPFPPRWPFDGQGENPSQDYSSSLLSTDQDSSPRQPATNTHSLTGVSPDEIEPTSGFSHEQRAAASYLEGRVLPVEFSARYTVGDVLGFGGFGFVCVGTKTGYEDEREAGVEVAIKFIFKDKLTKEDIMPWDGMLMEAFVLSQCHHPNVIGFVSICEDDDLYYLVAELHGDQWNFDHAPEPQAQHDILRSAPCHSVPFLRPGTTDDTSEEQSVRASAAANTSSPLRPSMMSSRGPYDLFGAVKAHRFDEHAARYIFRQLVEGVCYLHSRGIYHRDLKDENVVIDRKLHVKIIDFGSAAIEDPKQPIWHERFRGTASYAPPEIINGRAYLAGPSDIWALGILLCIILTGRSPFPDTHSAAEGRIQLKRRISASALDLMSRCFNLSPIHRISIEDMRFHPWLTGAIPNDTSPHCQLRAATLPVEESLKGRDE